MRNWIIIALLMSLTFGAKAGDFELDLEHFTSVKTGGSFKLTLQKGEVEKAQVRNNDEDVDDEEVLIEVVRDELRVKLKNDTYKERKIEIVITYIDLDLVTAKKGCQLVMSGVIDKDTIQFEAESGGKIKAELNTKKVSASISAGGSIHLSGTTAEAEYNVTAGGTIATISLAAAKVAATVKAGGEIICTVEDELNIKITSGGNVSYYGEPKGYEEKITLGGKITKMNKTQ